MIRDMKLLKKKELKSSLAISTIVGCRNQCSYCPQKVFTEAYRSRSDNLKMSIELFEKCILTVPKHICLSFSGFSEPWLNPDCTSMILSAHHKGFKIRVNTTLVGMKTNDLDQLKDIPFVKFVVHLPDDNQLTKIHVNEQYLEVIVRLLESGLQNLYWKFHNSKPEVQILPEIHQLLIKHRARIFYTGVNNRAGNVQIGQSYNSINKNKILCECQDFRHNILLPNGDVALCHMDWSLKHILGNLTQMKYEDLYRGKSFQKILNGLKDINSDILCRSCEKDIVSRTLLQNIKLNISHKISGDKSIY